MGVIARAVAETLAPRAWGCGYGYYWSSSRHRCIRRSGWYFWGRWVVVGVIIVCLLLSLLCCMRTARRRRRNGAQPYYGTGWLATGNKWAPNQNNPNAYNMNSYNNGNQHQQQSGYGYSSNPPPAYGQQQPQYTGSTFNPNDGYYGHQSGVQSPPAAYGNNDYAPPTGPPPGK
jgi:hypothetical protein